MLEPVCEWQFGEKPYQKIDVYAPANAHKLPVLLFFHGGAWINGGREWLRFMAPAVLSLPAIFVAATYRLAPKYRWPIQYEDVCRAIHYCHSHIENLGGVASNIIVGGHSSGGHLASLAVLKQEIPEPVACFPVSSAYNLQYGQVADESPEARVYKYLLKKPEQDFDASPINFVKNNKIPFHISWGEKDFDRIIQAAMPMINELKSGGASVSYSEISGASHFDTHLQLKDPQVHWYKKLREAMGIC